VWVDNIAGMDGFGEGTNHLPLKREKLVKVEQAKEWNKISK
jgi:hypothetical protein